MSIHSTDPFATPEELKSPIRRLRGRLPAAVTLWTAYGPGQRPAGLTVSSMLVVEGEPGRVLGLLDEESDLWAAVQHSGRFVVAPLTAADAQLADQFAGQLPAPGGAFKARAWRASEFGPVLESSATWAGCSLDHAEPMGWSLLIEATIDRVEIVDTAFVALLHHRGRYTHLTSAPPADDHPDDPADDRADDLGPEPDERDAG